MRTLAGTTGTWLLAGIVLVAADFWEERDLTAWSDKDVEKMLTDSPWAQQVRIAVGSLSEAAGPTSIPAPSNPDVRLFQNAGDRSLSVTFLFPKTDVITLDDREVELITRLIDSEVKKKFKLADMVFRDQLEL